jgi:hypothetical protein
VAELCTRRGGRTVVLPSTPRTPALGERLQTDKHRACASARRRPPLARARRSPSWRPCQRRSPGRQRIPLALASQALRTLWHQDASRLAPLWWLSHCSMLAGCPSHLARTLLHCPAETVHLGRTTVWARVGVSKVTLTTYSGPNNIQRPIVLPATCELLGEYRRGRTVTLYLRNHERGSS